MNASREWPAKIRWIQGGSQLITPLQDGVVRWNGKMERLELSLVRGGSESFPKEALFLPARRPSYKTLSLTARISHGNSLTEVTIQFHNNESMEEAYVFLKNVLPAASTRRNVTPKSRGLYQHTTPKQSRSSLISIQRLPRQSSSSDSSKKRLIQSFEKTEWHTVEKAEKIPSTKSQSATTEKIDNSRQHKRFSANLILRDFLGTSHSSEEHSSKSQNLEARDQGYKEDELRRKDEPFKESCDPMVTIPKASNVAEGMPLTPVRSSVSFYGDKRIVKRTEPFHSHRREPPEQTGRRTMRPLMSIADQQECSEIATLAVVPAHRRSSPFSAEFRRRISDVNEALLCSNQSPIKSPLKKPFLPLFLHAEELFGRGGFANLGATCYMNAVLQAIFSVETFSKELLKTWHRCSESADKKGETLMEGIELLRALSTLASRRMVASAEQNRRLLRSVMEAIRSSTFSENRQEDAQEFMAQIFDQLSDECDKFLCENLGIAEKNERSIRNPVTSNFLFTLQNDIICESCGHKDTRCEESTSLPIDFGQPNFRHMNSRRNQLVSVQTMLDHCLRNEKVEHRCDNCGSEIAEITHKFQKLPRCLVMYLKRYTFDAEKRADSVDIPLFVTLNGHCAEVIEPFAEVPPSTKKINFLLPNSLRDSEQRSPQKQRTEACNETCAVGTPSVARNPQEFSADDGVEPILMNHQNIESPSRKRRRKSSAIRKRLWSDKQEDSAAVMANELGLKKMESDVEFDKRNNLGMLRSPLKQSCDSTMLVSNLSKLLSTENAWGTGSSRGSEVSTPNENEENVGTLSSSATNKGCIEMTRFANAAATPLTPLGKTQYFTDSSEKLAASPYCHISSKSSRREPFTSEELANMSECEQMKVAIEWSVRGREAIAEKRENFDKQVANNSSSPAQVHGSSEDGDLEYEMDEESDVEMRDSEDTGNTKKEKTAEGLVSVSSRNMPVHVHPRNASNTDSSIFSIESEQSCVITVPYKPITQAWRVKACNYLGLKFVDASPQEEPVEMEMGLHDYPTRVAPIAGDGNCLFRALAYAITGGSDEEHAIVRQAVVSFEMEHEMRFRELSSLDEEAWRKRIDELLKDGTWGSASDIIACATMLQIDIWTFLNGKWLCYRPRFKRSRNGLIEDISCREYRFGRKKAIYLLNENYHYSPVIEPSNTCLLAEQAYEKRLEAIVANSEVGEMIPSYRLVSIVSHHGMSSSSGHYVCDVWNQREHRWLHCDDSSVSPISQKDVLANRTTTGYLFFYMATELVEEMKESTNERNVTMTQRFA